MLLTDIMTNMVIIFLFDLKILRISNMEHGVKKNMVNFPWMLDAGMCLIDKSCPGVSFVNQLMFVFLYFSSFLCGQCDVLHQVPGGGAFA